jgi:hypothetical protein
VVLDWTGLFQLLRQGWRAPRKLSRLLSESEALTALNRKLSAWPRIQRKLRHDSRAIEDSTPTSHDERPKKGGHGYLCISLDDDSLKSFDVAGWMIRLPGSPLDVRCHVVSSIERLGSSFHGNGGGGMIGITGP